LANAHKKRKLPPLHLGQPKVQFCFGSNCPNTFKAIETPGRNSHKAFLGGV